MGDLTRLLFRVLLTVVSCVLSKCYVSLTSWCLGPHSYRSVLTHGDGTEFLIASLLLGSVIVIVLAMVYLFFLAWFRRPSPFSINADVACCMFVIFQFAALPLFAHCVEFLDVCLEAAGPNPPFFSFMER